MTSPPVRFMYIGNLEAYQGIDLLISAFALHHGRRPQDQLIIIGGTREDIDRYRAKADGLGLNGSVDFRGHQPVGKMAEFVEEADVLVSPRIKGTNTPMKIYSYLDAGKPVLATDLFTHTQVLDASMSVLTNPEPRAYANGMLQLAESPELREQLGRKGREAVKAKYSKEAFQKSLDEIYDYVEASLRQTGKKISGKS
jgi:glycosyltransferase involved in cell wall biosynthesis